MKVILAAAHADTARKARWLAEADAIARLSSSSAPGAPLLPPMQDLRTVSAAVAVAVATTAAEEGLAGVPLTNPIEQVHQAVERVAGAVAVRSCAGPDTAAIHT